MSNLKLIKLLFLEMENFLFISVAGIGAYLIYRNVFGLKSSRQQTTPARDHPAGNRVPVKTTEPFAKIDRKSVV